MGGGEMGYWVAPAVWNMPDPDEYVRIRGDQLKRARRPLRASRHQRAGGSAVRRSPAARRGRSSGRRRGLSERRYAPAAAAPFDADVDARSRGRRCARSTSTGTMCCAQLRRVDRQYPDDFALLPIRGYAAPHALTLDLGDRRGQRRAAADRLDRLRVLERQRRRAPGADRAWRRRRSR